MEQKSTLWSSIGVQGLNVLTVNESGCPTVWWAQWTGRAGGALWWVGDTWPCVSTQMELEVYV